jgi:hypothetical protein
MNISERTTEENDMLTGTGQSRATLPQKLMRVGGHPHHTTQCTRMMIFVSLRSISDRISSLGYGTLDGGERGM